VNAAIAAVEPISQNKSNIAIMGHSEDAVDGLHISLFRLGFNLGTISSLKILL
jgi:hypothetical protein